tara:strand:- start:152 stop:349 length:198 start_codon:yes stop_codon:yes gene_type:complete
MIVKELSESDRILVDSLTKANRVLCDMTKELKCSNVSNDTLNYLTGLIELETEANLDSLYNIREY